MGKPKYWAMRLPIAWHQSLPGSPLASYPIAISIDVPSIARLTTPHRCNPSQFGYYTLPSGCRCDLAYGQLHDRCLRSCLSWGLIAQGLNGLKRGD